LEPCPETIRRAEENAEMYVELNTDQQLLLSSFDKFCRTEIEPNIQEWETGTLKTPAKAKEVLRKLADFGLFQAGVPEEYGGLPFAHVTVGLLVERLARAYPALACTTLIQFISAKALAKSENSRIKQEWLPSLCAGERVLCVGITEPNVGSNPSFIESTLTRAPGGYRLNGSKTWISNGGIADAALVVASVDRKLEGNALAMVFVDREKTPYDVRDLGKLGWKGMSTTELHFDDVFVPEENVVFAPGAGFKTTLGAFETMRPMLGLVATGTARAAIDHATVYARERKQSGKLIGTFQQIQRLFASMLMRTDAGGLLCFRALRMLDAGMRCEAESAMAKAYATEAAVVTTSEALQVFGGYGLSTEYPMERLFRDARMTAIPEGTTQILELVIARKHLGLSAF
jgi:alkylation response protein AidB-like acyl-CoA dehydrogenase